MSRGGLRLDSQALGFDHGRRDMLGVALTMPEDSLLLKAVRHQDGLAMPPDGKLNETQIAALATWIKAGAVWPGTNSTPSESIVSTASGSAFAAQRKHTHQFAAALVESRFADAE